MDERAVSTGLYTALTFFMTGNARQAIGLTNNAAWGMYVIYKQF